MTEIIDIIKIIDKYKKTPSGYSSGRNIIEKIFATTFAPHKDCIITRLTIIDSLYSTNVSSRRLFGIEDIAKEIEGFGDDNALRAELKALIQSPDKDSPIKELFSSGYGINKGNKGNKKNKGARAVSLISKYCYFLMLNHGGFPIYDSLVLDIYPKLVKQLEIIDKNSKVTKIIKYDICSLIKAINRLSDLLDMKKEFPNCNHYDLLDGYMWFVGKIGSESYSLVLSRKAYVEYIKNRQLPQEIMAIRNHAVEYNLGPKVK